MATTSETKAIVNKFLKNTYGNVSEFLMKSLVAKGFVDPKSRRLTESGICVAEFDIRNN